MPQRYLSSAAFFYSASPAALFILFLKKWSNTATHLPTRSIAATVPIPIPIIRLSNSRPVYIKNVADRVGFEPTVRCRITGFQDQLLKPLGHLSTLIICFCVVLSQRLNYYSTVHLSCQPLFQNFLRNFLKHKYSFVC